MRRAPAMRSAPTRRSPRIIACALLSTSLLVFLPYKLARDSKTLELTEQPTYRTCPGAPVRTSGGSWWPGKRGALKDLRSDERLVQQYVDKCIAEQRTDNTGGSGIAIPAGGIELLSNALVTVTTLRQSLRSILPIEVIYNGLEEYDEKLVSQLEVCPPCLRSLPCLTASTTTQCQADATFLVDAADSEPSALMRHATCSISREACRCITCSTSKLCALLTCEFCTTLSLQTLLT